MELVIVGTATCAVAVMITAYMFARFLDEVDNGAVFALILGIALTAFFGLGIGMVQTGMNEQQTIQVESGDM